MIIVKSNHETTSSGLIPSSSSQFPHYCLTDFYCGLVVPRLTELDGLQQGLHDAQVAVNDVARILTGSKRGDHIRITDLLKTAGLQALNQMAIQSLATMTWDAFPSDDGQDHDQNGLAKTIFGTRNDNDIADVSSSNPVTMTMRSKTSGEVTISLKNNCLVYNAVKIWNACPTLRAAASKSEAKGVAVKLAREAPP
jgi:hypothetical protein